MEDKSVQISEFKKLASEIWIDRVNTYLKKNPKSDTLKKIRKYTLEIRQSKDEKRIFKLARKVSYFIKIVLEKTNYMKGEEEYWRSVSRKMFEELKNSATNISQEANN
jgi:hypothetical protein